MESGIVLEGFSLLPHFGNHVGNDLVTQVQPRFVDSHVYELLAQIQCSTSIHHPLPGHVSEIVPSIGCPLLEILSQGSHVVLPGWSGLTKERRDSFIGLGLK